MNLLTKPRSRTKGRLQLRPPRTTAIASAQQPESKRHFEPNLNPTALPAQTPDRMRNESAAPEFSQGTAAPLFAAQAECRERVAKLTVDLRGESPSWFRPRWACGKRACP